jgi:hypothetical protein
LRVSALRPFVLLDPDGDLIAQSATATTVNRGRDGVASRARVVPIFGGLVPVLAEEDDDTERAGAILGGLLCAYMTRDAFVDRYRGGWRVPGLVAPSKSAPGRLARFHAGGATTLAHAQSKDNLAQDRIFNWGWVDSPSSVPRDRRPRQRLVAGSGVPSLALGHRARRVDFGHRRGAEPGGDRSDAPVGGPRPPKRPRVEWGSARRRGPAAQGRRKTGAEVGGNLVNHRRLRDARDDPHRALAGGTRERGNLEELLLERRRRAFAHRRAPPSPAYHGDGWHTSQSTVS